MIARRLTRGERGAAVVEFVLVLPVFLAAVGLVLFGAWVGVVKTIIDHGAREGALYAAIPSSADLRSYPTTAQVAAEVDRTTPLVSPTNVTVTNGVAGVGRAAPFKVRVEYQVTNPAYVLFAPLRVFGWGEVSETLTVTSEAEMRRE